VRAGQPLDDRAASDARWKDRATDAPHRAPVPLLAEAPSQPEIWQELLLQAVHPVKIAILEAVIWTGKPLSKNELTLLFDDKGQYYLSLVSYHVDTLVRFGVLKQVGRRTVGGATETYYFFPRQS
jgi:hypothetical protein